MAKNSAYLQSVIDDDMNALGEAIFEFRNLGLYLAKRKVSSPSEINSEYQKKFDQIIDCLCNVNELGCIKTALSGIEKSLMVRRKFVK